MPFLGALACQYEEEIVKFEYWVLFKGMLMGAADIVPGVSGGTVAFITGIYERLLNALKMLLPSFVSLIKSKQLKRFVLETDLIFLITLFSGILVSVASLAKIISYLMVHFPIPLWSSFFGLILASVFVVAKDVKKWSFILVVYLLLGALVAWGVTQLSPASIEKSNLTIFFSGMLAICAMVLPGISGSFILVILGSYSWILAAIKYFEWTTLGLFVAGCFIGLLSIANVLSWAFEKFKDITLSILTGFMLGAMVKVWPWKEVISYRENSQGELIPLMEEPITPFTYEILTGSDSQILLAIFCASFAAAMVYLLSRYAGKN
jgi:putative membrane protein